MATKKRLREEGSELQQTAAVLPEVPEFVIRGDSKFGLDCMIVLSRHVDQFPVDERRPLLAKLREFDLYEEAVRTAAAE